MELTINKREANIIQVAIDHLFEMHTDVLADSIKNENSEQVRRSYHIQRMIGEIHAEIEYQLSRNPSLIK
jgi:hypothetical protein